MQFQQQHNLLINVDTIAIIYCSSLLSKTIFHFGAAEDKKKNI